ncbi:hypothetical protein [Streptomyces mirabilis]|uniref:hypothetical protein n=1 Tax=Streptomyces mirabilis TaxID=68239 RepID=UPI0036CA26BE
MKHPRLNPSLKLALDPAYRIEGSSTKFGGLRITVADRFQNREFKGEFTDHPTALTGTSEIASEHTCDSSGTSGRIRLRGDKPRTLMQSSSDVCRSAQPHKAEPTASEKWPHRAAPRPARPLLFHPTNPHAGVISTI